MHSVGSDETLATSLGGRRVLTVPVTTRRVVGVILVL